MIEKKQKDCLIFNIEVNLMYKTKTLEVKK